jgi:hypothetical protein
MNTQNIHLKNNLSIKVGDHVKIDGIDSHLIFEFTPITRIGFDIHSTTCIVKKQDVDNNGNFYNLYKYNGINSSNQSFDNDYFCGYTLSKIGSPKHLDINKIRVGNICIIGKDLERAPKIINFDMLSNEDNRIENSRHKKFNTEESNNVINQKYIVRYIYHEYILISQMTNKYIQYVFPYWFLYNSNIGVDLYKPKPKIIRSFDEF